MNSIHDERSDDSGAADLTCASARGLVPGYLDGELTEAQASPLRAHLFACPACRETAKDEKNLKRWFSAALVPSFEVPPGFAARVARRAFAGDPGLLTPAAPAATIARGEERTSILPFLLELTAVAAALLLIFAVAIQTRSLPTGDGLEAGDPPPWERQIETPGFSAERRGPLDRPAEDPVDGKPLPPEGRR